ncbi:MULTISPECIES: TadE family protein [unclassified Methylobacterium]|uniref:TadE family protein n=1 Tax=unclassified Methylobacterium TaxID=2615210 RepID=UPI001FCCFD67|nr:MULTISPECIES: TadE family protein [unclassified Methylobacterium]
MAAIEFALIMPILFAIMLGGIQVVSYTNAARRVDLLARSIGEMISQAVPPAGASEATVNALDLHFAYDAALVTFPYVMADAKQKGVQWWQNIAINFASIRFTPVSGNCQASADPSSCREASVVWTSTGVHGGGFRTCTPKQTPVDDTNPPSATTLPRSIFGAASIVVVDVVFTFKPTFGENFVPAIKIARTAYMQPRYATLINYDTTNSDGIGSKC